MNNSTQASRPQVIPRETGAKKFVKAAIVFVIGAFCALYILNPGAGFVEFIPDNIPVIGNLDEAAAIAILISCCAYFGIDARPFSKFFNKKK